MSPHIEQHQLTESILIGLNEILPELNQATNPALGERLKAMRAAARRLHDLGPGKDEIAEGYRNDAIEQAKWLAQRFFGVDATFMSFTEDDLQMLALTCTDLAAKLAQYKQVKIHLESGEKA